MSVIEAIVLGILQGLTEFLPVSSSGHLELGSFFLGIEGTDHLLFSVLVHAATALSTIIVFRKDILELLKDLFAFKFNDSTQYTLKLALSMIPVGVIGVLWKSEIESFFGGNVVFVASMLLITGLLLLFSHFKGETSGEVTYWKAFIIGISQAIAVLPGISRSGSTISTALILGVSREKAARFSFLMVLVPILGAALLQLKDYFESPTTSESISILALSAGFIAALLSGIIACRWMIQLVKRGKLLYFAIYCFVLGSITLIFYW